MKRLSCFLLMQLLVLSSLLKAQTSVTMGLNGMVKKYVITEYDNDGYGDREIAVFNPKSKRLVSFKRFCVIPSGGFFEDWGGWVSFNVKGNRPTTMSKFVHVPSAGDAPDNLGGTVTLSYRYAGNKLTSMLYKCVVKGWIGGVWNFEKHRKTPGSYTYETGTVLYKYTYTRYDYFGNWTERSCEIYADGQWDSRVTERREITYDEKWMKSYYLSNEKKELSKYEKNDDLGGLKNYLKDDQLEEETKVAGKALWNKMVMNSNRIQNTDSVRCYYADTLTTSATREDIKNAWSHFQLSAFIKANNFDGLYQLSVDSLCSAEVADSARAYWNEKKWTSVGDVNADYQSIAKVAAHPFSYPEMARAGWILVQQKYYNDKVLQHNNFRKVEEDYQAELEGKRVFTDPDYASLVLERRDSLRRAEIDFYLSRAQTASDSKKYEEAVSAAQHVLDIDPNIQDAIVISAENGKQQLTQLKKHKKLTDEALATYISQNPKGQYTSEMMDFRALRLAYQARSKRLLDKFSQIEALPMSDDARKKVNSLSSHTRNRITRGSFFHVGGEASIGYGFAQEMLDCGGGLYVRLGWNVAPINLTTGFTYSSHKNTWFESKPVPTDDDFETNSIVEGAMDYATMEIPVQLRWNFVRKTAYSIYLAAGAEYHLNKKGKVVYSVTIPRPTIFDEDKEEKKYIQDNALLKKSNFVGYYSLGFEFKHGIGAEFYVKHDYTDRFDKKYVREQYGVNSPQGIQLTHKAEDTQLGKNFSIGLKLRIFY